MNAVGIKTIVAIVLLALLVSLTACSYLTEFVILNDSAEVVRVQYRVKPFPGEFAPPVAPAILPGSQLNSHAYKDWTKLDPGKYKLDAKERTVSVSLMPGQALRMCDMANYMGHSDAGDAQEFPVDQIRLEGSSGARVLSGDEARTTFTESTRSLYVLTYK